MLERLRGVPGVAQLVEEPRLPGSIMLADVGDATLAELATPLAVDELVALGVALAGAVAGMHRRGCCTATSRRRTSCSPAPAPVPGGLRSGDIVCRDPPGVHPPDPDRGNAGVYSAGADRADRSAGGPAGRQASSGRVDGQVPGLGMEVRGGCPSGRTCLPDRRVTSWLPQGQRDRDESTASSSSVVFPVPCPPRSTSVPLKPPCTASSTRSMAARSWAATAVSHRHQLLAWGPADPERRRESRPAVIIVPQPKRLPVRRCCRPKCRRTRRPRRFRWSRRPSAGGDGDRPCSVRRPARPAAQRSPPTRQCGPWSA